MLKAFFGQPDVEKLKAKNDIQGLIKALVYQRDAKIRQSAVIALGVIGNVQAVEPLIAALKDTDAGVRFQATKVLGQMGDQRAVTPLTNNLHDNDDGVRETTITTLISLHSATLAVKLFKNRLAAVQALGELKDDRAMESLLSVLGNSNEATELRKEAISALVKLGDPTIAPHLVEILISGKEMYLHKAAADALGHMGWQPTDAMQSAVLAVTLKQWDKVDALGQVALQPLLQVFCDKEESWNDRVDIAGLLAKIRDPQAVEALRSALHDKHWRVQEASIKALESTGWQPLDRYQQIEWAIARKRWDDLVAIGTTVVDPLIDTLTKELKKEMQVQDRSLMVGIVGALGTIADLRAIESIKMALKCKDNVVRDAAVEALSKIKDTQVMTPLIEALKYDEANHVRRKAAKALGQLGDKQAVEPLIDALKDKDPSVREEVSSALGKLGDARAIVPLTTALQEVNTMARAKALQALRQIDSEAAKRILVKSGISFNPLDILPNHVSHLLSIGLIRNVPKGGTLGYRLTDDGLLYIDGMFCKRDCADHPNTMADLKAVSRGRMIILNGDQLTTLATIFLGEQLTTHVVSCAEKMGYEMWINGVLMDLAGPLAHGVRHSKQENQTAETFAGEIELTQEGRDIFQKQLAVTVKGEEMIKLIRAALESWQKPVPSLNI